MICIKDYFKVAPIKQKDCVPPGSSDSCGDPEEIEDKNKLFKNIE
jgi:hypothetical protein